MQDNTKKEYSIRIYLGKSSSFTWVSSNHLSEALDEALISYKNTWKTYPDKIEVIFKP